MQKYMGLRLNREQYFHKNIRKRLVGAWEVMDREVYLGTISEWKLRYWKYATSDYFICDYPTNLQDKLINVLIKRHRSKK